jgi:hypothetical protein
MSQISKVFVWNLYGNLALSVTLNFFGNLVFLKVTYDVFLMLQLQTEPLLCHKRLVNLALIENMLLKNCLDNEKNWW